MLHVNAYLAIHVSRLLRACEHLLFANPLKRKTPSSTSTPPMYSELSKSGLSEATLTPDPPADGTLHPPRTQGLALSGWQSTTSPKLNGRRLALDNHERSRSLAIAPDGKHFLLGTVWWLRLFDRQGRQQWAAPVPDIA